MNVIKLFDYQEDMKERIEKALRLHRSVMAQMPTGTGKTVLLASVVESFLREHSNCNVWIVAHRRELVSQIRETIQRVFFESPRPSLAKEGFFSKTHPQWSLHPLRFPRSRGTETSGSGDVTALLGARNRYAIRLTGHQSPRQIVRDGTAGGQLAITCWLRPPFLFLIAVSLCTCRHSNEEYYFLFYF